MVKLYRGPTMMIGGLVLRSAAWRIYGGILRFARDRKNKNDDPEGWQLFSEKIMFKQRDEIVVRFQSHQIVIQGNQMAPQSAEAVRRPRADAVRNRERVLAAAKAVFSAGGPDASLEAVARRAGVGIGTLYRHFPTREALFEAVYRREVQQLGDLAEALKSEASPVDALRRWLRSNGEFVATQKGMSAALALAATGSSDLTAFSFERLTKAVGALLDRAVAAAEIRSDISPEDILHQLAGT